MSKNRRKTMKQTATAAAPAQKREEDHGQEEARAQLGSIIEMMTELQESYTERRREAIRERIQEDPLEVVVRSGWYSPGARGDDRPEEFKILLTTGGPACRIIGELDEHLQPNRARIEYQDWFTPWTELRITGTEEEAVLAYCREFYFGEHSHASKIVPHELDIEGDTRPLTQGARNEPDELRPCRTTGNFDAAAAVCRGGRARTAEDRTNQRRAGRRAVREKGESR